MALNPRCWMLSIRRVDPQAIEYLIWFQKRRKGGMNGLSDVLNSNTTNLGLTVLKGQALSVYLVDVPTVMPRPTAIWSSCQTMQRIRSHAISQS